MPGFDKTGPRGMGSRTGRGLVLAVPMTTFLAAYYLKKYQKNKSKRNKK